MERLDSEIDARFSQYLESMEDLVSKPVTPEYAFNPAVTQKDLESHLSEAQVASGSKPSRLGNGDLCRLREDWSTVPDYAIGITCENRRREGPVEGGWPKTKSATFIASRRWWFSADLERLEIWHHVRALE